MLDETGDTDLGGEYGPDVGESSQWEKMFKQSKEKEDMPQVNNKKEYNKLIREHETLKRQFQEMKRNY